MQKIIIPFLVSCITVSGMFSQDSPPLISRCASSEATVLYFKKHPELKQKFDAQQASFNANLNKSKTLKVAASPNYTIPVVFHILHLNGNENISDAQVFDQMRILNLDFAKKNLDTSVTLPVFKPIADSTPIRFALAQIDPNGNCTSGIVRYFNGDSKWVDSSPTLYAQNWDPSKYLNVYVVKSITLGSGFNAAGYTYLPGSFGISDPMDAIVILHDYVGTIGTSNMSHSHVLTHEVGHWFDLLHVFGWNSCAVDCSNDDFVFDTPQTPGYLHCPSISDICTPGVTENYQNFMDYSYCESMFTHGQVLRMDAAAHDNSVGRSNLWSASNLMATGLQGVNTCAPFADFVSNKTSVCAGQTVTYTSWSQTGGAGSITWNFQGGIPSTSTATSVVVSYPTIGLYSVSLVATNSNGSNTLNKMAYMTVTNGASTLLVPYTHNFETTGLPGDITVINTNVGSIAWVQNTTTGANSTSKSIYLNNASVSSGDDLDIFETPMYDFSHTTNVGFSYWYAYARNSATQGDTFKVQYSVDCGGTWKNFVGIPALSTMASNSGGITSSPFAPTALQWKQVTILSAFLVELDNIPSVKIRFYFRSDPNAGSSNNIYIDEINLYGTVGLNELEQSLGLTMYPNPTNGSSIIDFTISGNEIIKFSVTDVLGRVIEESTSPTINGKNVNYIVNKNGAFAKGIYMVNIDVNNQRISKKLIID